MFSDESLRIYHNNTLLEIPPCPKPEIRSLPSMAWQMALGSLRTRHETDIIPVA